MIIIKEIHVKTTIEREMKHISVSKEIITEVKKKVIKELEETRKREEKWQKER